MFQYQGTTQTSFEMRPVSATLINRSYTPKYTSGPSYLEVTKRCTSLCQPFCFLVRQFIHDPTVLYQHYWPRMFDTIAFEGVVRVRLEPSFASGELAVTAIGHSLSFLDQIVWNTMTHLHFCMCTSKLPPTRSSHIGQRVSSC